MKLAEALARRKDIEAQLAELSARISANATMQEGEQAEETPDELLASAWGLLAERKRLALAISRANQVALVEDPDGGEPVTMTEALAQLRSLDGAKGLLDAGISTASYRGYRSMRSELRTVRGLSVKDWTHIRDQGAKKRRQWDLAIQQTNWSYDLPESDGVLA